MTKQQFKKKHGAEWAKLVRSEMFNDAIETLETAAVELKVLDLSPKDVHDFGPQIVAAQQGFLSYANALSTLHEPPKKEITDLGPAQYPNPEDEIQ
jgi:DNA-binding ferritin-like protein (Dps family)